MKDLRTIRIFLSVLFFAGAVAYLAVSPTVNPMVRIVERAQIIPSMIATSMGAILVWIVITLLFGRVYCSTVCPIGTLQDLIMPLRKYIKPLRKPFSYQKSSNVRYHILLIYIVCLIVGVGAVSLWIEPWNMMGSICGAVNHTRGEVLWSTFGIGMATGIAGGILSAVMVAVCALFTGRGFCTQICPVGTALGYLHFITLYHIDIDPDKCINCMKCEEICKSQCIKVVGRVVDNSRCVRCFDCLKVCPNDAIRFQINRNRRINPLFRKVRQGGQA